MNECESEKERRKKLVISVFVWMCEREKGRKRVCLPSRGKIWGVCQTRNNVKTHPITFSRLFTVTNNRFLPKMLPTDTFFSNIADPAKRRDDPWKCFCITSGWKETFIVPVQSSAMNGSDEMEELYFIEYELDWYSATIASRHTLKSLKLLVTRAHQLCEPFS